MGLAGWPQARLDRTERALWLDRLCDYVHGRERHAAADCPAHHPDGHGPCAVGTFVLGIMKFSEAANFARFFSVGLIVVGILGLKLSSSHLYQS